MGYKHISITGFPKGITDKYEDGDYAAAQKLDNVNLRDNGKPETRDGSWIFNSDAYRTVNELDAKLVLEYDDDTLFVAGGKVYLYDGSTFAEKKGVNTAIDVFPEADNDTFFSSFNWKDQFIATSEAISRPVNIFKDDTDGWKIITNGLPKLASDPSVSATGGAGEVSYIAAFCHKYTYNINSVEYIMRGAVRQVQFDGPTGAVGFNYTSIPELANGTDTHYELADIDIEVYRTIQNGIILYLDQTIDNGTTSVISTSSDTDIEANARIYTDGGVLDNDLPPKCKYVMQGQNYAYYMGTEGDLSKGLEAKPNEVYGVPGANSFKIDREFTGGGIIFDNFFCFAKNKWYILNGHYSTQGAGSVVPRIISNTDGVLYNTSFVNTTFGAVAFGQNSFLFCNGTKVTPASNFNELYKDLVANSSASDPVVGTFDPINKRAYFSCKSKSETEQNETIYVFHEKLWGGGSGSFTTWSGKKYFSPRYIQWLDSNKLFRGEAGGWLLVHDEAYKYDPVYKDSSLPASWSKLAVREDIITAYLFGDSSVRKWGSKMLIRAKNRTNLSIQPSCSTDGSGNFKPMSKVDIRTQLTWGEAHVYWEETPNIYWEDSLDIQRMVNMPSGFARFTSRQLRFQKAMSIIYMPSQGYANDVTVDASTGLVTFNGSVPATLLEQYLLFEPYNELYLIIQQQDTNVFRVSDPNSTLVSGTYAWIVKGYPLYQIFSPLEFIMYYVEYGESQSGTQPEGITNTK